MPLSAIFAAISAGAGRALTSTLTTLAASINFVRTSSSSAAASVSSFATGLTGLGNASTSVNADNESLIGGISKLAFLVSGSLTEAFEQAKQVALGFYNAVIGANDRLQKEVSQNAIVFSQSVRVFDVFGNQVSDAADEIRVLQTRFEKLTRELDFETRGIVGATDARTREVLKNVTLQTSSIITQAEGFKDLEEGIKKTTIALTSAFGAFDLPDQQIPQEIRALLTGDVTNPDATLARQLQISRQEFDKAAGEGKVLQLILEKTRSVQAGNAVLAETLTNSFSNIRNIVDVIFLRLGESSFPAVEKLVADFAKFLAASEDGLINLALETGKVVADALEAAIKLGKNIARLFSPVFGALAGIGEAIFKTAIPGFVSLVEIINSLTVGLLGAGESGGIVATNIELIGAASDVAVSGINLVIRRLTEAADTGKTLLGIRLALKLIGKESSTTAEAAKELREQQEANGDVILSQLDTIDKKIKEARLLPEGSDERKRAEKSIQLFVADATKRLALLENADFGAFEGERQKLDETADFINARFDSIKQSAETSGVALEESLQITAEKIKNEGSLVERTLGAVDNAFRNLETIASPVERTEQGNLLLSNLDKLAKEGGLSIDELAEKLTKLATDDRNNIDIRIKAQEQLLGVLKQQESQIDQLISLEKIRAEVAAFDGSDTAIATKEQLDRDIETAGDRIELAQRRLSTLSRTEIEEQRSEVRLLEERLNTLNDDFITANKEGRTKDAEFAEKQAAEVLEDLEKIANKDLSKRFRELGTALKDAVNTGEFDFREIAKEFDGLDTKVVETAIEVEKLQLELQKLEAERPTKVFEAALSEFSRVSDAADAAREQAAIERNIQIEALLRKRLITEEKAAVDRLEIEQATSAQQLAIEQARLEALEKLEFSTDPAQRAKQELEIQKARNKVTQLRLDQLKRESQLESSIRQEILSRLQKEEDARARIQDVQQKTLDLEIQRGAFVVKSLDRQLALIQSRNELAQTFSDLETARADKQISDAEKAIQLNRELQNPQLARSRRLEIRRELEQLGASGLRLKDLEARRDAATKQRQELEKEIARAREEAEAKSLEFELRKQELALQRQEIEAQIAVQRAKAEAQSLEAEKARAKLNITNPEELESVLNSLNKQQAIQDGVVKLRQAELGLIKRQQVDQIELAKNQRKALDARTRAQQIREGREERGIIRGLRVPEDRQDNAVTNEIDNILNDLRNNLDKFNSSNEEVNQTNKELAEQVQKSFKEANDIVASEVRKSTQAILDLPAKLSETLRNQQPEPLPDPKPDPKPEPKPEPAANNPLPKTGTGQGVLPLGISQGLARQLSQQNFQIQGADPRFDRFINKLDKVADKFQDASNATSTSSNTSEVTNVEINNNFPSFDSTRFNLRLSGK